MKNQWVLQPHPENKNLTRMDYDDYGCGAEHPISIGDEIEAFDERHPQFGVVVGIIRNVYGIPVCYKVVRQFDDDSTFEYDYIQAKSVTLAEPCGSSEWSLGRIGYEPVVINEDPREGYYFNKETKDVVLW